MFTVSLGTARARAAAASLRWCGAWSWKRIKLHKNTIRIRYDEPTARAVDRRGYVARRTRSWLRRL